MSDASSSAFIGLKPRPRPWGSGIGCLAVLGGPLMAFGLWLIGVDFVLHPETERPPWLIPAGAATAAIGLALIVAQLRRTSSGAGRQVEVAVAGIERLIPGALVPIRIQLAGPARLARLTLSVVCERHYKASGAAPSGSKPAPPADAVEVVWTQELLHDLDVSLGSGENLTRVLSLALPRIAKASGPTLPSGDIRWYFDVAKQPRSGRVARDIFDIQVVLSDSPETSIQPAAARGTGPAWSKTPAFDAVAPGCGCLVCSLAFLVMGPAFLLLYFSDPSTVEGNPLIGLIGGVLFTVLGVLGLYALASGRYKGSRRYDPRDPQRLP
jgi:hypothetical protein